MLARSLGLKKLHFVATNVGLKQNQRILSTSNALFFTSFAPLNAERNPYLLRHQKPEERTTGQDWLVKRAGSLALGGCLVACAVAPGNAIVDFTTVTLLCHHCHAGFGSIFGDYLPLFMSQGAYKVIMTAFTAFWIIVLGLLYSFNYNDVGFSNAVMAVINL